jgi:hypothetical protein
MTKNLQPLFVYNMLSCLYFFSLNTHLVCFTSSVDLVVAGVTLHFVGGSTMIAKPRNYLRPSLKSASFLNLLQFISILLVGGPTIVKHCLSKEPKCTSESQ